MGEVVHGDYRQWAYPEGLSSTTNYEAYKGLWSSHNDHNYFEIAYTLNKQFGPKESLEGSRSTLSPTITTSPRPSILKNPAHLTAVHPADDDARRAVGLLGCEQVSKASRRRERTRRCVRHWIRRLSKQSRRPELDVLIKSLIRSDVDTQCCGRETTRSFTSRIRVRVHAPRRGCAISSPSMLRSSSEDSSSISTLKAADRIEPELLRHPIDAYCSPMRSHS